MSGPRTALALAMAFLVLSIVLIPWLDEMLREAVARKEAAEAAANDNARAATRDEVRRIG